MSLPRNAVTLSNGRDGFRAALSVEVRVLDSKKGLVEYVASDETLDSYREVVRADGWRFTHFKKNAPLVDSHDYSTIEKLLGKVIDFTVKGKQLIETAQWAVDVPDAKLAQIGWKMTETGYLKAVSVGFFPTKYVSRWDSNAAGYLQQIQDLGFKPEDNAAPRVIYLEQEQIELSVCIIGANPNALARSHVADFARAYKAGVLDDDAINFLDSESKRSAAAMVAGMTRHTARAATDAADAARAKQRRRKTFLKRFEESLRAL